MRREPRSSKVISQLGRRLRDERVRSGISQRTLADRTGVSASLISQLENSKTRPSLSTLLVVADELGMSVDWLIRGLQPDAGRCPPVEPIDIAPDVVSNHVTVNNGAKARWTQLNDGAGKVRFLYATIRPGGSWPPDDGFVQHNGREYAYVLSGLLRLAVATSQYILEPEDAIAFDSHCAHRVENHGTEVAHAVWFIWEG